MPQVLVSVPDRHITVNGLLINFKNREFPEVKDGLTILRWDGEPESGDGYMQFSDDYMMKLAPKLYEEEVLPWVQAWGAMKDIMEAELEASVVENAKTYQSEESRFERLRARRDMRLAEYDIKMAQIQRQIRVLLDQQSYLQTTMDELIAKQKDWDAYAQALCALPQQAGAPWDGGDNDYGPGIVPWPKKPE